MENCEHADLLRVAEALDCHRNPHESSAPKKYTFHTLKPKQPEVDVSLQGEITIQSRSTSANNDPQQGTSHQGNTSQMQEIYIDEDLSILTNQDNHSIVHLRAQLHSFVISVANISIYTSVHEQPVNIMLNDYYPWIK